MACRQHFKLPLVQTICEVNSLSKETPADRKARLMASIKRACARKAKQRYGKPVSPKRLGTIQGFLLRGANRIWSLGYHIDEISRINDTHLQALAEDLKSAGFSESTVTAYLGAFQMLASWQGRSCRAKRVGGSIQGPTEVRPEVQNLKTANPDSPQAMRP